MPVCVGGFVDWAVAEKGENSGNGRHEYISL
jgi:hypothetical protein